LARGHGNREISGACLPAKPAAAAERWCLDLALVPTPDGMCGEFGCRLRGAYYSQVEEEEGAGPARGWDRRWPRGKPAVCQSVWLCLQCFYLL